MSQDGGSQPNVNFLPLSRQAKPDDHRDPAHGAGMPTLPKPRRNAVCVESTPGRNRARKSRRRSNTAPSSGDPGADRKAWPC
jgi:hypothetical protein